MRNITIKPSFTETDHKSNYNVINQHVDDDYYVIDFYPEDFELSGNATIGSVAATLVSLPAANEQVVVAQLTEGSICEFKFKLRPRQYWVKGNLETTIYYTGDVSSTNNIRLTEVVHDYAIGDDISSTTAFSVVETTAGPSTAYFLKKYTMTNYFPYSRENEIINYRIVRFSGHAADTYTGDVFIVAIKIRLVPAMIQEGAKGIE